MFLRVQWTRCVATLDIGEASSFHPPSSANLPICHLILSSRFADEHIISFNLSCTSPGQSVECKGSEENVFDCTLSPWGSGGCEDDDILTVICSNVSINEPRLTLNSPTSSSFLSFLPNPSPLRIPSMSLPGLGDIPVCLEGEGAHEASLLCSSQGLACGLPSYPKLAQNWSSSPYSVALSCPTSSDSLASCALTLTSTCQVNEAMLWLHKQNFF